MVKRKIKFIRKPVATDGGESQQPINGVEESTVVNTGADDGARGSDDSDPIAIDPASIGESADPADGTTRKRGRPKGSRNTATKKGTENLEALLLGIHGTLAVIASTPELEITEGESKTLARALTRVQEYYGESVVIIPEWLLVWGGFAMAMGQVYGPRVIAISKSKRKKNEKQKAGPVVIDAVLAHPPAAGVN